eukprot:TRINITY_DN57697_c0_g1_i1.p1 TRINITY_DN57697_c0_g1~~TRINITY_DN57697_c0_g1_i1.p1  ORF type:complete len:545 (-),score=36.73 TRINITY_DN57697_c0_g1_i1:169-1803(-)
MFFGCSPWGRLDQRFRDGQESNFQESIEHSFFFPGYFATTFVSVVCCWNLYHTSSLVYSPEYHYLVVIMRASNFLVIAMSASTFGVLLVKHRTHYLTSVSTEMMAIMYASFALVIETCGNAWHLPLLFGERPELIFPDWDVTAQEGTVMLSIATWSCGCCLTCPIRSHLAWIVAAVGMVALLFVSLVGGSPYPEYMPSNTSRLVALLGFVLGAAYQSEKHSRERWLAQVTVKHQQEVIDQRDQAVSRILNTFCDCLLQTGSDFSISEPCPRLAAMLMSQRSTSLVGQKFVDYLASEHDRTVFLNSVRTCDKLMDMTPMIPVQLRDMVGVVFGVSMYYTCFHDTEGELRYLIGLVESDSRASLGAPAMPAPERVRPVNTHLNVRRQGTSNQSSGSSVRYSKASDLEDCSVTIKIGAGGCQIQGYTSNFALLTGSVEIGQCFVSLLPQQDQLSFLRWVQGLENTLLNSCSMHGLSLQSAANREYVYDIESLCLDQVQLRTCFAACGSEDSSVADEEVNLRLVLRGVRRHVRKAASCCDDDRMLSSL